MLASVAIGSAVVGKTKPAQVGFMDSDMLALWDCMGPLPGGLQLYGGTALALYLNHRNSTDFDFATTQRCIDTHFMSYFPWLSKADLVGGPGMVDATIQGEHREIKVTFMETGCLIPNPMRAPLIAPNGVAVAHPVDLLAAKYEACLGRGALRDYVDVATAFDAWPSWAQLASRNLPGRHPAAVGRAMASPPLEVEAKLTDQQLRTLHRLARTLAESERGLER